MKYQYIYGRGGREISKIRKKINLSQEELALNVHIDRSYLAEIEEGKNNPSLKVLLKISRGLSLELWQLLKRI